MTSLIRNKHRAFLSLVLTMNLLGLIALDAEICRGADGHLGVDSRAGSCCESESPDLALVDLLGRNPVIAQDYAVGGSDCEDAPLLQGALTSVPDVLFAGNLAALVDFADPVELSSSHLQIAPSYSSNLSRLRSISLQI